MKTQQDKEQECKENERMIRALLRYVLKQDSEKSAREREK